MDVFTPDELAYLDQAGGLARIATVAADGTPHVTPVGWSLTADRQAIEIGGSNLTATKKFRDIQHFGRAAVVIDDVLPPWRPRGLEVRGPAEAIVEPEPRIRIRPARIVGWGFEGATGGRDTSLADTCQTKAGREAPRTAPYAVVRRNRFQQATDSANHPAVATEEADFGEFLRVHAAQPGYQGNLVVDAGDGVQLTVTVWASEQHAAGARAALGPVVQQLLAPSMDEPSQLLAVGEITSTDLLTLRASPDMTLR